ncbi:hypothetical protein [Acidithiobacillus concretivorus]|uniref:Lipoprotein n=1 Tax=Acidithiobacillus concretivorus TaxID=3063952 RepID=A0ABS5ZQH5_9PROT|nr:hypothetical protein [Acidithiobacillus concretivorus]MBU2738871.1 hypothetical protein [Acidithiobacillus concretivorus]
MQRFILAFLFVSLGCLFTNIQTEKLNDTATLSGLHNAKSVFLVNMRNPAAG